MDKRTKAVAKLLKATKRHTSIGDFQYVVQRPRKAKICFGSGMLRENLQPVSRHNSEYTSKPLPQLAPGMYPLPTCSKPISKKGTVLGGRTAARFPSPRLEEIPPPGKYNIPEPEATNVVSFGGLPRFKKDPKFSVVGPGYYKPYARHRSMAFAHCFGGKKRLVPAIQMKCGPVNTDTCERCKKSPDGDYWQLINQNLKGAEDGSNSEQETWYLCRPCHEKERKNPKLFSSRQIQQFRKVRDCSKVHFHDGCDARILLLPPRDIDKIQEKEAYMALYFP